jgi:hypothetical protein
MLGAMQLNGQSAGAAYGDDDQMNENYPIVRLRDPVTGNVYYCRTSNWSSVAVAGSEPETVDFTLNSAVTPGSYQLTVVGAGIASQAVPIAITSEEIGEHEEARVQLPAASSALAPPPVKLMRVPAPIHGH